MRFLSVLLLLPSLLFSSLLMAASAEERGLEIVTEVDLRDSGWDSSEANMKMELRNKHGDKSTRIVRSKTLEVENDGDKSLTIFDKPRDVSGTALLTFSHATEPDDQWIYLPALGKVKRISTTKKSGPFMGSEFSFEDMSSYEIEKYTYKYLKDETLDGKNTLVVESYPEDKHSGYKRLITWYDAEHYIPLKIVFYDRKNSLLKTLLFNDYKQYLDTFWRPDQMTMENHQTGKSTILFWSNYRFKTGLNSRDFNRASLKRAK